MKGIYLIVSEDTFLAEQKVKELIAKASGYEVVYYDLQEDLLTRAIEDLDTYNFFTAHKMIVLKNCKFLSSNHSKNELVQDTTSFSHYLENPNLENTLVIVVDKLDERKKLVKLVKEKSTTLSVDESIETLVRRHLDDFQMDAKTLRYLLEYCSYRNEKIMHELEKLKLYKLDEKVITIEDINRIVEKEFDDNIFDFVDCIIAKQKQKAYQIYQHLLLQNEEPMKIMILVANQFRIMYQVKVLSQDGMSEKEIASFLEIHPYRVKLAKEKSYSYSFADLRNNLKKLAEIDYQIKSGKRYGNLNFEMFLLNL